MSSEIVKNPEDNLTQFERDEVHKWRRSKEANPLALTTSLRMYQLFLLGHSCEDIVLANNNQFSLGMILDARVRHDWDRRRAAYIDQLYKEAGDLVRQRQVESGVFLADMLAATHTRFGPQLQKFIQTRDPKDLPETFQADSITKYKMVVDALLSITGQDKKKPGPSVNITGTNVTVQDTSKKPLSSEESFNFLRSLDQLDKGNK